MVKCLIFLLHNIRGGVRGGGGAKNMLGTEKNILTISQETSLEILLYCNSGN